MAKKKAAAKNLVPARAPVIDTYDEDELAREWNEREERIRLEGNIRRFLGGPGLSDRMMRYRQTAFCPDCLARPVVCLMLRPGYSKFRCRACGLAWEIKGKDHAEISCARL